VVPGGILADPLAVNSVTARAIGAGEITGDKVAVKTLTGNNIADGEINSVNIAATLQSTDYTSGENGTGWRIFKGLPGTPSEMEIDAAYIRGTLSADHIDSNVRNYVEVYSTRSAPIGRAVRSFDPIFPFGYVQGPDTLFTFASPFDFTHFKFCTVDIEIRDTSTPSAGRFHFTHAIRVSLLNTVGDIFACQPDGNSIVNTMVMQGVGEDSRQVEVQTTQPLISRVTIKRNANSVRQLRFNYVTTDSRFEARINRIGFLL